MRWLRSVLPQLTPMLEDAIKAGANEVLIEKGAVLRKAILPELYDPWSGRTAKGMYHLDAEALRSPAREGDLPVPPPALRQGYSVESEEAYIEDGAITARHLRAMLEENDVPFDEHSVVLDWGCASGRVLRHFRAEAERAAFWGTDQYEHCILWDRENLSPPFRFVTCTAYPHLPFEDNMFTHIYGISIFTHIVHLADVWLMELRRILKPGGHLLVTVHTEAALDEFERGYWPPWLDRGTDLDALRRHDFSAVTQGTWDTTFPFYKAEWLRKDWPRFMEVVDLREAYIPYVQTAVLLRKS
jgi:ubiquinone/menaquinone biosynthesis C-methylase UbiE